MKKKIITVLVLTFFIGIIATTFIYNFPKANVIAKDSITLAQEKITEADTKLKEEEARLDSEMKVEDDRHTAEVSRIEAERERIRLVRLSFISAPAQPE